MTLELQRPRSLGGQLESWRGGAFENLNSVVEWYSSLRRHREPYVSKEVLLRARYAWQQHRQSEGLSGAPPLLTHPEANKKLNKSDLPNYGLTLQHVSKAGVGNLCPWATKGCKASCVLDNGNGLYPKVQHAREVKTRFLAEHPFEFVTLLVDELMKLDAKHDKFLMRFNVNSDLPWHRILPSLFDGSVLKNMRAYDYTKDPSVLDKPVWAGFMAPNYRLIYSWNERSDMDKVIPFLEYGGNVAVVTDRKKGEPVQTNFARRSLDGDKTDDRFHESRGFFVDLTAKGRAKTDTTGFVVRCYHGSLDTKGKSQ